MSQCSPWPQPSPSWRNSHFICLPFLWFSFELIPSFLSSLCSDICSTSKIIDLVLWRFMAVMTKPRLSFFPLLFINFFFLSPSLLAIETSSQINAGSRMEIQCTISDASALKGAVFGDVLSGVFLPLKIHRKSNIFPFSLGVLGQESRLMPASFTAWEHSLENLLCFVVFLSAPIACWEKKEKKKPKTIPQFPTS